MSKVYNEMWKDIIIGVVAFIGWILSLLFINGVNRSGIQPNINRAKDIKGNVGKADDINTEIGNGIETAQGLAGSAKADNQSASDSIGNAIDILEGAKDKSDLAGS